MRGRDVYKRQHLNGGVERLVENNEDAQVDPWEAVSYTHLDVYKRQGEGGSGFTQHLVETVNLFLIARSGACYTHGDVYKRQRNIFIPVEYFLVIARYDFQPFEIVRTFRVAGLAYIVV